MRQLVKGHACDRCMKNSDYQRDLGLTELIDHLREVGTLDRLELSYRILSEYESIRQMFRTSMGVDPSGSQRAWFLRLLRGESFALTSPPGLGKTTFGIFSSVYLTTKGKKSVLIFPSRALVNQVVNRVTEIGKILHLNPHLIYKLERRDPLKELSEGKYDIAVITSRYLMDHLEEIDGSNPDFFFVDDVDSAMKSGRSALTILKLAGYSQDVISNAQRLIRLARSNPESYTELEILRKNNKNHRIFVLSSASINRTNPLFRTLLGFRPGSASVYARNVLDIAVSLEGASMSDKVLDLVRIMGPGGLVFVPVDLGQEYGEKLAYYLREEGINASTVSGKSIKVIDRFASGEIDVLVGVATHYGILVRGIDLPWRIKYAVFAGIPKFKFRLNEKMHPIALTRILGAIGVVKKDREASNIASYLRRKIRQMSPAALSQMYRNILSGKVEDRTIEKGYSIVSKFLEDEENRIKIASVTDTVFTNDDFILIPDYMTYLQASARTSRLYGGGLTTGASFLIIDHEKMFELLQRRLSFIIDDMKFQGINEVDLRGLKRKIDEERSEIEEKRSKGISSPRVGLSLFIVESPNKAKTISNFFSKPSVKEEHGLIMYETAYANEVLVITYSGGHIYDLTTDNIGLHGIEIKSNHKTTFIPVYDTIKRCESRHQFVSSSVACPLCGKPAVQDKVEYIEALRKLALEADRILIGTDPDTEGEKIAWDIYLSLRPFNKNIQRVEFHEITSKAIREAIRNARSFDENLIASQVVRRIEDRWIGFELSRRLQVDFWRKYCIEEGNNCNENYHKNLSAGRVQTPVLGWVIDHYGKHMANKRKVYPVKIEGLEDLNILVRGAKSVRKGTKVILNLSITGEREESYNPLPPYTTSTVLEDLSNFYNLPAGQAMSALQVLFENGLITYHRTDSIRISDIGIQIAQSYLREKFPQNLDQIFKPRTWGEGGAHEAIRPTKPLDKDQLTVFIQDGMITPSRPMERIHFLVYDLVFRRFISSQMAKAIVKKKTVHVEVIKKTKKGEGNGNSSPQLVVEESEREIPIAFVEKGFAEFYSPFRRMLGDKDSLKDGTYTGILGKGFYKSDTELFSQGSLIAEMKRKGIGRPSTYANIVSTIIRRGYVIETLKLRRIIPTRLGSSVYSYLNYNYLNLVSEERTRELQAKMDMIEQGKIGYTNIIEEMYKEITAISEKQ